LNYILSPLAVFAVLCFVCSLVVLGFELRAIALAGQALCGLSHSSSPLLGFCIWVCVLAWRLLQAFAAGVNQKHSNQYQVLEKSKRELKS
jgi:hypothetical protein